jgi:two-component system, response regulator PdtaR
MDIFICEDNFLLALDLEGQVEDAGHRSLGIASRSQECLDRIGADRPDVVILDLNLADGRTGPDLLLKLNHAGIPSIVVSGEATFLDRKLPALAVLEKPIRPRDLLEALAKVQLAGTRLN